MGEFSKANEDKLFADLIERDCRPLLFKGAVDDWPALKWTPQYLADVVGDKLFRCKISERDDAAVCPETECLYLNCSLHQYCDWLTGCCKEDNPLQSLAPDMYSCYVDYKYMKDMFADCNQLLQEVRWDRFGFPERTGSDSTIWIGSTGAYTPCHQDTYGFNLVTQLYGSKRWFLFDPSQSPLMYSTRVPYEESSIFSEVNVLKPDLKTHKLFKDTTPYVVDLHPGDTLYVPRHWWHFVQCTDSSISVNTWVPVKEDQQSHINESITRFLMSSLIQALPGINLDTVLNPTEELTSAETSLKYIERAIDGFKDHVIYDTEVDQTPSVCDTSDGTKTISEEHTHREKGEECNFTKFKTAFKHSRVSKLPKIDCQSASVVNISHKKMPEEDSPTLKKIKLENQRTCDECITNKEEVSVNRTEILSLQSFTFPDYLSLLNYPVRLTDDATYGETTENSKQDSISYSDITSEMTTDMKSTYTPFQIKSFQYNVFNAILSPNVIDQISHNILNKTS